MSQESVHRADNNTGNRRSITSAQGAHASSGEIFSLRQVSLDPYPLSLSVRTLAYVLIVIAYAFYLLLVLRRFQVATVFDLGHAVFVAAALAAPLIILCAFGVAAWHASVLRRDVRRVVAPGDDVEYHEKLCELIERRVSADLAALRMRERVYVRYARAGSPYVLNYFRDYILVVGVDWMKSVAQTAKGPEELKLSLQSVLLHELAHIYNRDVFVLGMTVLLYGLVLPLGLAELLVPVSTTELSSLVALPTFAVCVLQVPVLSYISKRRECFADMMAVRVQRTIRHIEQALMEVVRDADPAIHGPSALLARRFVSRRARRWIPAWVQRLVTTLVGHHYSPERRAEVIRSGMGEFSLLRRGDLFILGMMKAFASYATTSVILNLNVGTITSVALIAAENALYVYLLLRITACHCFCTQESDLRGLTSYTVILGLGLASGHAVTLAPMFGSISGIHEAYLVSLVLHVLTWPQFFRAHVRECMVLLRTCDYEEYRRQSRRIARVWGGFAVFSIVLLEFSDFVDHLWLGLVVALMLGGMVDLLVKTAVLSKYLGNRSWRCRNCNLDNPSEAIVNAAKIHLEAPPNMWRYCERCRVFANSPVLLPLRREGEDR